MNSETKIKKPFSTTRIVQYLEAHNGSARREDIRKSLKIEGYTAESIRQGLISLQARKIIVRAGDGVARTEVITLIKGKVNNI